MRSMLSPATRRILLGLNNGKCVSGRAASVRQQCYSHLRQTSLSSNLYPTSYLISQSQYYSQRAFGRQKRHEYAREQIEFDTSKADANSVPTSLGRNAKDKEATRGSSGNSGEFSNSQPEFDSPQNPNENTDPTSQSSETPGLSSKPFPDLRQGIPSTFDAELDQAATSSQGKAEGEADLGLVGRDEVRAQGGGRNTGGELPKSAYESSQDRRRNRVMNYTYAAFGLVGLTSALYLGREWESDEDRRGNLDIPSGWAPTSIYSRAKARLTNRIDSFTEPSFPKLLPTLDPTPPYTLVLSLEDLLIHSEWTRDHGWRMAKRPGVDYFLRYLTQYYELVIFTTLPFVAADPVIRKLDPYRIITWPLFREATRYEKGEYVKDLSYLNRDLSKVILIDTKPSHAKLQPENAILLPPWKGDAKDRDLVALIPFLEHVASMGIEDTRKAIGSFHGKHIPTEFAIREAKARDKFQKDLEEERSRRPKSSGMGLLASSLGMKPTMQGFEEGKMLSDQIRERGQKMYEAFEKEIRENGEKWLKELEAEEKKMQEESMKSMKSGFTGWFGKSN